MLKHGILGLLNYKEMTGYEIMETFRDSLNYFWDAKTSQIYRELQGLEQKEWVNKRLYRKAESLIKTSIPSQRQDGKNCCDGLQMMT